MNEKKLRLPPQIVGNAGLFFVCHRLSQLGWNAMPTSRNARGVDVMCFSVDGKRKLLLQVKSLSRPKPPVPLGKDIENFMGDFWVIVTEATAERPTCYILSPKQVKDMAHRGEKDGRISYWLPHKRYAVEEFCEKWDRIGPGC